MDRQKNKFNIEEGSVAFWVKKSTVNWSGEDVVRLFEITEGGNSIFIVKDSDAKLKFFHVYLGRGRTNLEVDVSDLISEERHHIVAMWSVSKKNLLLYIDAKMRGEEKMSFNRQ